MALVNGLFVEVCSQEAAQINGGETLNSNVGFNLGSYIFAIGAGTLFGNQGLTQDETQKAWELAVERNSSSAKIGSSGGGVPNIGLPGFGGVNPDISRPATSP